MHAPAHAKRSEEMAEPAEKERKISRYSSAMDVLLVGEGDFSFASALAAAFKRAPRLVATSLNSRETLRTKYPSTFKESLGTLVRAGAVVMHDMDATQMAECPRLPKLSFDCIVFNFPHSGFVAGWMENTPALIKRHQELLRLFFHNAKPLLNSDGEIHVTHHVHYPYSKWNIAEEANKSGLRLKRCPKFKAHAFPGYTNRRGNGAHWGRTFPNHNAATFIFVSL